MPTSKENFGDKKGGIQKEFSNTTDNIRKGIEGKTNEIFGGIENKKKEIEGGIANTKQKIGASIDKGKRTVTNFFKKLLLLVGVLAILSGIAYYLFASMTYSDGSRAGQLIKVSEKGVVFKTFEGQLSLGGISVEDSETNIGSIWNFSVVDDAVFQKLETLRGQKVVIQYEEKYRALPWKGDTNYLVTGVDPIK